MFRPARPSMICLAAAMLWAQIGYAQTLNMLGAGSAAPVSSAAPSYTFVQGKYGQAFSGTTASASFTTNVTAGNAILICAFEASATLGTFSFSDTRSNSYTNGVNTVTHGANQMFTAYASNVAGGSTTVTLTFSLPISIQGQIWIEEWSGVKAVSPADGGSGLYTAGSNTAGQAYNTGSFTPTTNGDLIWACGRVPAGGGSNVGSGFASAFADVTDSYLSEFQTQITAGSVTPGFAAISGGFDLYAISAGFKH